MITFLDYIRGGCQIALNVAIDFTTSNGDPNLPESLHYRGPAGARDYLNEYERAVLSVGRILQEYDSDKKIPVYGFGGKLPNNVVSHCWPLNGNETDPSCQGVEGMLQAYRLALNNVQLWAPTNFSPCIQRVIGEVHSEVQENQAHGKLSYSVLLIVTGMMVETAIHIVRMLNSLPSPPLRPTLTIHCRWLHHRH